MTGPYQMQFDLRVPDGLESIPGTERVFRGRGMGSLEVASFTFGHGLFIPQDVWLTWQSNRIAPPVGYAEKALIGQTEGDAHHIFLTCYGDPPYHVIWLDPPGGVVDARQPHAIADSAELEGIETMLVAARSDAHEVGQWSFCETDVHGVPNDIAGIEAGANGLYPLGDGLHTIRLDRPISPGATNAITYDDDHGTSTGVFKSHPANVNGDAVADVADIGSLIDCCLNETCTPTWGNYSCDIDRSGKVGAADLLRLIDLLNGADTFAPWMASDLPPDECEP